VWGSSYGLSFLFAWVVNTQLKHWTVTIWLSGWCTSDEPRRTHKTVPDRCKLPTARHPRLQRTKRRRNCPNTRKPNEKLTKHVRVEFLLKTDSGYPKDTGVYFGDFDFFESFFFGFSLFFVLKYCFCVASFSRARNSARHPENTPPTPRKMKGKKCGVKRDTIDTIVMTWRQRIKQPVKHS